VGIIGALELAGSVRPRPASLQIAGPYRFVDTRSISGDADHVRDRPYDRIAPRLPRSRPPSDDRDTVGERSLGRTFGADCARYKRQVPWRVTTSTRCPIE
jgi:hypothetical protein